MTAKRKVLKGLVAGCFGVMEQREPEEVGKWR